MTTQTRQKYNVVTTRGAFVFIALCVPVCMKRGELFVFHFVQEQAVYHSNRYCYGR